MAKRRAPGWLGLPPKNENDNVGLFALHGVHRTHPALAIFVCYFGEDGLVFLGSLAGDLAERAEDTDFGCGDAAIAQSAEHLLQRVTFCADPVAVSNVGPDVIPGVAAVERLPLWSAKNHQPVVSDPVAQSPTANSPASTHWFLGCIRPSDTAKPHIRLFCGRRETSPERRLAPVPGDRRFFFFSLVAQGLCEPGVSLLS